MSEVPRAGDSAVVIIETADAFITEGRPEIPGVLALSGQIGLFGGHVEPDQTPYDAVRAELDQELGLQVVGPLQLIKAGDFPSQNKHGEAAVRSVSLFHVALDDGAGLVMKVPDDIVQIPKSVAGVEDYKAGLTPFTYRAVTGTLPAPVG